jgi:hypothetical protein
MINSAPRQVAAKQNTVIPLSIRRLLRLLYSNFTADGVIDVHLFEISIQARNLKLLQRNNCIEDWNVTPCSQVEKSPSLEPQIQQNHYIVIQNVVQLNMKVPDYLAGLVDQHLEAWGQ